jgi:hypothetical protein
LAPPPVNTIDTQIIPNSDVPVPAPTPPASGLSPQTKGYVTKKKLLLYFLIGFFTNIIGSILALIWIAKKVKENKKPRAIALGIGMGLFFYVQFIMNLLSPLIAPKLQELMVSKFPELKELLIVQKRLNSDFPDSQFSISLNKNTTGSLKSGESNTQTSINVTANTKITSGDFRKQIGTRTCQLLTGKNILYDDVRVVLTKTTTIIPIINFNTYVSTEESRTCSDWESKPAT